MIEKPKYWAEPVPGSVYGNVIGILHEMKINNGEIVDFGCGYGPLAEPLQAMGFDYLGLDNDVAAVSDLKIRGVKSLVVNLEEKIDVNYFSSQKREPKVALLLDVLEHFKPNNNKLEELITSQTFEYLIISVPNVANRFILNKIAMGEFEYESTGLLDETHLAFYTRKSLDTFIENNSLIKILENNTYSSERVSLREKGLKSLVKFLILRLINFFYKLINKDSEILQFVWVLKN